MIASALPAMSQPSAAQRSLSHSLRQAVMVSFAVALPLNLIASPVLRDPLPAVGLVPMLLPILLAPVLRRLSHVERHGRDGNGTKSAGYLAAFLAVVNDAVAAIGLLVVLVITWVHVNHNRWWYDSKQIFLISYATAPMIASMFAHIYLALFTMCGGTDVLGLIARAFARRPAACPHCHEDLQPAYSRYFSFARERAGGYRPIQVRDAEEFRDEEEAAVGLLNPAEDNTGEVPKGMMGKGKGKGVEVEQV
jgi:hypothetical protein